MHMYSCVCVTGFLINVYFSIWVLRMSAIFPFSCRVSFGAFSGIVFKKRYSFTCRVHK